MLCKDNCAYYEDCNEIGKDEEGESSICVIKEAYEAGFEAGKEHIEALYCKTRLPVREQEGGGLWQTNT